MKIGAALFNGDHAHLADELARLEAAGCDFVHWDVFDGYLVPDLAFPPRTIETLRPVTKLRFDVHLIAREPERFLPALARAGADLVCVQAEACPLLYDTLFAIREQGMRAGVALAIGAPLEILWPVLNEVDAVLVLARVLGEGARGASFHPGAAARLRAVARRARDSRVSVELQAAGGLRVEHAGELAGSGATALALGSGLYRAPDMAAEVARFREAARAAS